MPYKWVIIVILIIAFTIYILKLSEGNRFCCTLCFCSIFTASNSWAAWGAWSSCTQKEGLVDTSTRERERTCSSSCSGGESKQISDACSNACTYLKSCRVSRGKTLKKINKKAVCVFTRITRNCIFRRRVSFFLIYCYSLSIGLKKSTKKPCVFSLQLPEIVFFEGELVFS